MPDKLPVVGLDIHPHYGFPDANYKDMPDISQLKSLNGGMVGYN